MRELPEIGPVLREQRLVEAEVGERVGPLRLRRIEREKREGRIRDDTGDEEHGAGNEHHDQHALQQALDEEPSHGAQITFRSLG